MWRISSYCLSSVCLGGPPRNTAGVALSIVFTCWTGSRQIPRGVLITVKQCDINNFWMRTRFGFFAPRSALIDSPPSGSFIALCRVKQVTKLDVCYSLSCSEASLYSQESVSQHSTECPTLDRYSSCTDRLRTAVNGKNQISTVVVAAAAAVSRYSTMMTVKFAV